MAIKKITVRTWDEALDVLDGKHLVLDGVDGVLRVRRRRDQYGPVLTGVLMHVPSAKGKKSEKYLETKRQLHDDWDTDLTGSERAGEIAEKFCVFANDHPTRRANSRVRVATVRPASGGFGMYEAGPEWSSEEVATVDEYVSACRDAGSEAFADGEGGIPEDAQDAIDAVDGNTYNQRGTLVASRWTEHDKWSIVCVDEAP